MNDINRVILIGRLTKDLEVKYTSNGAAIGNGSIAVSRTVKQAEGYAASASFFDFKIFGKLCESLRGYMTKGKQVAIDGYLKQETWQGNDGSRKSRIIIGVDDIELLGSSSRQESGNTGYKAQTASSEEDFPEDLPF